MKAKIFFLFGLVFIAFCASLSAQPVWSKSGGSPPDDPTLKYRDYPPNGVYDPDSWRLLVDIGTNVAFSGTVSASTNVNLANVTTNNPLPVQQIGTNEIVVTSPLPVFVPSTNSIHVTIDGGTNTLEVASPIPFYTPTGTNIAAAVNTQTNVGGFTYVGAADFPVDKISTAIVANDVYANVVTITNATRASGGTGILNSLTCVSGDNRAPAFTLLVSADALSGLVTNAVANLTQTEIATNLLGIVDFATSDFKQIGTNYIATKVNLGVGIKPLATTLYLYAVSQMSITNTNAYTLKWTIYQD